DVATALDDLAAAHRRQGPRLYYRIRDERFNPLRERLRAADGRIAYTSELAAMLIFLNRTGFNGLFRLNASGAFNVPHGRNLNPRICDEDNLRAWSRMLHRYAVQLDVYPFEVMLERAGRGDFVYLDPPYAPVSGTARFTSYTADGFD